MLVTVPVKLLPFGKKQRGLLKQTFTGHFSLSG
jgi:hypothetical protein